MGVGWIGGFEGDWGAEGLTGRGRGGLDMETRAMPWSEWNWMIGKKEE